MSCAAAAAAAAVGAAIQGGEGIAALPCPIHLLRTLLHMHTRT